MVLRLHRPHRPTGAGLEAVQLGEEEVGQELLVLGSERGEVGVVVVASLLRGLGRDIRSHKATLWSHVRKFEAHTVSKLTCRYFWQSVMASENSPDQVFRGEPSMSSLILDLHIQRFCSLLAFCIFCIGCNALIT